MCKIVGCPYQHNRHTCVVCNDGDSNHYAVQCLKGTEMYHGTSARAAEIIQKEYFNPTKIGSLGQGVYFASNFHDALNIALYKFRLNWAVIKVKALVEPDEDIKSDPAKLSQFYNDVAMTRYHQAWANLPPFKQIVIRNPKRIRIIQIVKREKKAICYDDRILSEFHWHESITKCLINRNRISNAVKIASKNLQDHHNQLLQKREQVHWDEKTLSSFAVKLSHFFELMDEFAKSVRGTGTISDI